MTSKLKNAEERLEKAFARLETLTAITASPQSTDSRIAALEAENSALRDQTGAIAGRLDDAIDRLQRILKPQ